MFLPLLCVAMATLFASAAAPARDSLGIYSDWGAFRDLEVPRCYAIAKARPSSRQRDTQPYASIGTWPRQNLRNQVHLRLSRAARRDTAVTLTIGTRKFALRARGTNAWARNRTMDAAIVAAIRSASGMTARYRDGKGRAVAERYSLSGAATAMDAATIGCARIKRR